MSAALIHQEVQGARATSGDTSADGETPAAHADDVFEVATDGEKGAWSLFHTGLSEVRRITRGMAGRSAHTSATTITDPDNADTLPVTGIHSTHGPIIHNLSGPGHTMHTRIARTVCWYAATCEVVVVGAMV